MGELVLRACMKGKELTLPPDDGRIGWLALIVWIRESRSADQLNYYPGPDLGL